MVDRSRFSELSRFAIRPAIAALVLAIASGPAESQSIFTVNNVDALYQAVNDPENLGAIVVVASGTYALTTKDGNGQNRVNGGRLVLQSGMALIGQNQYVDSNHDGIWDPRDDNSDSIADTDPLRGLIFAVPTSETIIDSANLVSGGQGAIRVGRDNRVEKLTVRNTAGIGAAIDVNVLPSVAGMHAEIRECLLEDGQRGVRLQNIQLNGIDSSAVVERNISRRHTGALFGFGIQVQNGNSTDSSWDVVVRNNLLYANRFGLFVAGSASTAVDSRVVSMRNLYKLNQTGINLFAGVDSGNIGGNGNSIHLTSVDDEIVDNAEVDTVGRLGAGVLAVAGIRNVAAATPSSGNELILQFIGTRWARNFQGSTRRDLVVYGGAAVAGIPGINNTARVLVRKNASNGDAGIFQFIDSQPVDLSGTNSVTVIGSNIAFTHTNVGIDALPDWNFTAEVD
jgi:hypothetical protein